MWRLLTLMSRRDRTKGKKRERTELNESSDDSNINSIKVEIDDTIYKTKILQPHQYASDVSIYAIYTYDTLIGTVTSSKIINGEIDTTVYKNVVCENGILWSRWGTKNGLNSGSKLVGTMSASGIFMPSLNI